jgi:DNA-directed RNA polymerase specialized sigma24 family protein
VNELLERLQKRDPQAATVIELKYFAGMSDREVSVATGKSHASIRRDWMFARAWMTKELSES